MGGGPKARITTPHNSHLLGFSQNSFFSSTVINLKLPIDHHQPVLLWGKHTSPLSIAWLRGGIKIGVCSVLAQSTSRKGQTGMRALGNFLEHSSPPWREEGRQAVSSRSHSPGAQNFISCGFSDCPDHHSARYPHPTPTLHASPSLPEWYHLTTPYSMNKPWLWRHNTVN